MRYEVKNEVVTFFFDNPKRAEETIHTQSFAGTGLTEQQIVPILDALVKKFRGKALATQGGWRRFLRPLFAYFQSTQSAWPATSADWQLTIYRFFQFYLIDTNWSQSRTGIRMHGWLVLIGGLLEFMKEQEVIPHDVVIPIIELKKIQSAAKDQPLLGQTSGTRIANPAQPPQKLLMDISFGMTDADYLDSVERKCRQLVNVIRETCLAHWDGLMQDVETGRQLSAPVTDAQIDEAIATGHYCVPHPMRGTPTKYASPARADGVDWALALVRRALVDGEDIGCVSLSTLQASQFIPKLTFKSEIHAYTALDALTALPQAQWRVLPFYARFYRFCGLLSKLDVAAVSCLLICEHPEFTSESLQNAQLLNVRGKPYLLRTDSNERSIYSLDKPRAGNRKTVVLTALSQKLVLDIVRLTAPVREVLRRAGDKTWRYLFLGVTRRDKAWGFLGVVEGGSRALNGHEGRKGISLTRMYPTLQANGLNKGSFDYRRLRNTIGIIKWFETGSIVEMSHRLGNTRKVALENYLPPALLHAWNTRIVRRFQNTLIVLAAHDEEYLLDVTDFSNMADLQHFIAQLIADFPANTSPLAEEVQKRLGSRKSVGAILPASTPGFLNIHLSPKSLGLLYAFSDLALTTLSQDRLDKVDALSGLAPRHFTDMASLLRHAAENNEIHPSLRETLDVPLLAKVHGQALALKIGFDAQFAKMAVKYQWADYHE